MNCEREGTFTAQVASVMPIEHRFQNGSGELKIEFRTGEETGIIYLDLSRDIMETGNNAGKRHIDISRELLNSLGHNLMDISSLNRMINSQISVYGKRNAKGYLNFYLNSSKPEIIMDANTYANYVASLFEAKPTPQQQFSQQGQTPTSNLFE